MYKRNRIIILLSILLPIASFLFSFAGFTQLRDRERKSSWEMSCSPTGEEIYQAIRVFKIQDYREIRDMPNPLQIGRALALASIIVVTGSVSVILLRQTLVEIAVRGFGPLQIAPGKLVVDLPEEFLSVIPELRSEHRFLKPVVLTVASQQGQVAKAAARAGLWVIEAVPTEGDFLLLAGVRRAAEIFIFGDNSAANLELALICQAEIARCKHPGCKPASTPPSIHVQIENLDVHYAYQPRTIGLEHIDSAYIVPFSIPCNAARLLLAGAALSKLPFSPVPTEGEDDLPPKLFPDTTYVLCGEGTWLRTFLNELIKTSVVDLEIKPIIYVLTPRAASIQRRFEAEVPSHAQLHALIAFHDIPDPEPESFLAAISKLTANRTGAAPWNLFCLLEDDGDNLSLASRVRSQIGTFCGSLAQRTRILFLARQTNKVGVDYCTSLNPPYPFLQAIGSYDGSASLESIARAPLSDRAARIAGGYTRTTEGMVELKRRSPDEKPALYRLNCLKREQNFAQADHLDVKLRHLGFLPGGPCNPDEVKERVIELTKEANSPELDRLAALEHLRWMQVHFLAGFEYAPLNSGQSRHPDDYRQHDCLVPYENLTPEIQVYDREAVLLVGSLVGPAKEINAKQ